MVWHWESQTSCWQGKFDCLSVQLECPSHCKDNVIIEIWYGFCGTLFIEFYRSIFIYIPKANLLGFSLWGRGLVTRKCTPRKTGTVLEPCWKLSLLGCKAGLYIASACRKLTGTQHLVIANMWPCHLSFKAWMTLPSVFRAWHLLLRVTLPSVFQSLTFDSCNHGWPCQMSFKAWHLLPSFHLKHHLSTTSTPSSTLDLLSVLGISKWKFYALIQLLAMCGNAVSNSPARFGSCSGTEWSHKK